uniref:DDB1- and CUL4-associated factor 4-like isoform X1 n=1 Tax=Styela clava TaxID=7725 RepID=UPI001939C236|nr:DDB1- and CUL4-associated factor 4-like isoform X1 [Styela clava]
MINSPSTSGNAAPELPGFYFDSERNRYFRLLPGTNNHNPLTRDRISRKKRKLIPPEKNTEKSARVRNVTDLLRRNEIGQKNYGPLTNYRTEIVKAKIKCYDQFEIHPQDTDPGVTVIMHADHKYNKLIQCLTKKGNSIINVSDSVQQNIAQVGFAHFDSIKFMTEFPLPRTAYTHIGKSILGYWAPGINRLPYQVVLKGATPFTCALSRNNGCKYFASYSKGNQVVLVSNVPAFFRCSSSLHSLGGPGYSIIKLKRDVLAQSFGIPQNIHHNGLRGGSIVSLDLRRSRKNCVLFSMDSKLRQNVAEILPLKDEISLIAAYRNPGEIHKILLWDMRFTAKPVLEYKSNCIENRCTDDIPYHFAINVDLDEMILTSVLPDLRARFWSVRSGEIVKTYPGPDDSDLKITTAAYSNNWKLLGGDSAIFYAVHNQGFWFCPFSEDVTNSYHGRR